jgi:methylenetetrahydrofolate reductase (NADPH)
MAHAAGRDGVTAAAQLAREASIEIGVRELDDVDESRSLLAPGTRVYVNHLPGQSWDESVHACVVLRDAGFEPVPHVPVRVVADAVALGRLLALLVGRAAVGDVLLIAGDYDRAAGPYGKVSDVLASAPWRDAGLRRVTFGAHPEGHPRVALEDIRLAEREKARLAAERGLEATFVTQFAFDAAPVLAWARGMHAHGVRARIVAGLAGPARLTTLFRFALRCGIGPSIRALGARPDSIARLTREHGPERLVDEIAHDPSGAIDGLHFFSFGGFLETAEWLHEAATGP